VLAVGVLLVVGLQTGRSLANLVAGNGWVFIDRADLFTNLGGLLSGQADAGLSGVRHPASVSLMWLCVTVAEVLVVIACVAVTKAALDRWGPGRLRGMATRAQAEALLGRNRLRKHAKVIRPDLYRRATKRAEP
jgi:hypothetical protein